MHATWLLKNHIMSYRKTYRATRPFFCLLRGERNLIDISSISGQRRVHSWCWTL